MKNSKKILSLGFMLLSSFSILQGSVNQLQACSSDGFLSRSPSYYPSSRYSSSRHYPDYYSSRSYVPQGPYYLSPEGAPRFRNEKDYCAANPTYRPKSSRECCFGFFVTPVYASQPARRSSLFEELSRDFKSAIKELKGLIW